MHKHHIDLKNWKKFPVLFSLYIAQSVPMSFFSTAVPIIMRQENYSLESIGLLQLVKLPWIAKFLWAPFIDNRTKNYKSIKRWIIGSEIFYACCIIAIGFFNLQTDFSLIIILIILAFIASACQDIGTDIFAIRVLNKEERCYGNSIQSAGSFIGSLLGTGVLLLVYYYFGWSKLLFLLAAFVMLAIVPLLTYKPKINLDLEDQHKVKVVDIFLFFRGKRQHKRFLLLFFFYAGIVGILAMLKPYMVDLGYNVKQIGFMSGIVGTLVATFTAIVAGHLIHIIGRKKAFYIFSLVNILTGLYFYAISLHTPTLFEMYLGICLLWGAYGMSTVIIFTSSMDIVRTSSEGTDFTIQIVITHLSSIIIVLTCGKIGDALGYSGLFTFEILMGILSLLIVMLNYPLKLNRNGNR